MDTTVYDYAIVGAGAAGLHLAMAMANDSFFDTKKILILEKSEKNRNDKTWCFWEKGIGKWDSITTKIWTDALFVTNNQRINLKMDNYVYKMIQALDFYTYTQTEINKHHNFTWFKTEVEHIKQGIPSTIVTQSENYFAHHVFDSRIEPDFYQSTDNYIRLLQHFKGWIIETDEDVFDINRFDMMDFRINVPETTCFTYILPFTTKKALVEFTFFSPSLVEDKMYDELLNKYITEILKVKNYTIKDTEKGVIPMSNFPFYKHNSPYLTKIGTAGGWVKPSSGYSFKNAEKYSFKIVNNLKLNKLPSNQLFKNKYRIYDTLFLDVLYHHNYLGVQLFETMYIRNKAFIIFTFLDEETSLLQDIKIMNSFQWYPFIRSIFKNLFS